MNRPLRRLLPLALLLPVLAAVGLALLSSCRSPELGLVDGRLTPCPSSPNCVCSEAPPGDERHVAPLVLPADLGADDLQQALRVVLASLPRTTLVEERPGYLRAECRTRWLRFVDDLELRVDEAAGVIHVRSASRLGYSDLGVNRRRVEELRLRWESWLAHQGAPSP